MAQKKEVGLRPDLYDYIVNRAQYDHTVNLWGFVNGAVERAVKEDRERQEEAMRGASERRAEKRREKGAL